MRKIVLSLLLLASIPLGAQDNPVANPQAIVTFGNARFTILTPELVRMEWSADRVFEDKASFVFINRNLPVPPFSKEVSSKSITIQTGKLSISFVDDAKMFSAANLSIAFTLNGQTITWKPGTVDPANLKGTTRTLDGTNGRDDVKLEDGIISRSGWALVDDSRQFLFDGSDWPWVEPRPGRDYTDWYFFGHGHDYKKALLDYSRVAGKIPLPPRYVFGYWWSRYWEYSESELRDLVADIRSHGIPMDVLIIDMDWHHTHNFSWQTRLDPFGQLVGWTGYTWNEALFPEPEKLLGWTEREKLKVALNLHPASGIAPFESQYEDFAKEYGFNTSKKEYIPYRMDEKKWAETYNKVILEPFERMGVDFWWLDWQQWLESKNVKGLSNTWWLNYVFTTGFERRSSNRPLLFHRWGGLGNHRYQIGFSGDTYVTWKSLDFQPYFTATASNVGYGYWSHDIGGHMGQTQRDEELYLRWIQYGIFSPVFRTHCTKNPDIERRFWMYPGYYKYMKEAIYLRYALAPYIYQAARHAYDSGISLCRPLYYDYPEREDAYTFANEYMFGDNMLVAPVTKPVDSLSNLAEVNVWLPEGEWWDWSTGSYYKGNQTIRNRYAVYETPVFARAGSIIPMYPKVNNLQQEPDRMILRLIPGGKSEINLYEDDGISKEYKANGFATTLITKDVDGNGNIYLAIQPRQGTYRGALSERSWEIRIPCSLPPKSVVVNGTGYSYHDELQEYGIAYEGNTLEAIILTPKISCDSRIEVKITYSESNPANQKMLFGLPGKFRRLHEAMLRVKDLATATNLGSATKLSTLRLESTPTRIGYHPDKTLELVKEFHDQYESAIADIFAITGIDRQKAMQILRYLDVDLPLLPEPEVRIAKQGKYSEVTISCPVPGTDIYFSLDGSEPDQSSFKYSAPLQINSFADIKVTAFKRGYIPSKTTVVVPYHWAKDVTFKYAPSGKYGSNGFYTLVDNTYGDPNRYSRNWLGFQGVDMVATIELDQPVNAPTIKANFLQHNGAWILLPRQVAFEVSTDGASYTKVYESPITPEGEWRQDSPTAKAYSAKTNLRKIRFVRVTATNVGNCPEWHIGYQYGGKAWIFVDEVEVK